MAVTDDVDWDDGVVRYWSDLKHFRVDTRKANNEEQRELDSFIKHLGLTRKECRDIIDTIHGLNGKRKTIWLTGEANAGKSTMFNMILSIFDKGDIGVLSNQDIRNMFWLHDCIGKKVVLGEELTIGPDNVDTCKMLFEANSYLKANQKGGCAMYLQHQLCLISSNLDIMRAVGGHRTPLESRMIKCTLNKPFTEKDMCPLKRTKQKYQIYMKYFIEKYNKLL